MKPDNKKYITLIDKILNEKNSLFSNLIENRIEFEQIYKEIVSRRQNLEKELSYKLIEDKLDAVKTKSEESQINLEKTNTRLEEIISEWTLLNGEFVKNDKILINKFHEINNFHEICGPNNLGSYTSVKKLSLYRFKKEYIQNYHGSIGDIETFFESLLLGLCNFQNIEILRKNCIGFRTFLCYFDEYVNDITSLSLI